MSISNVAWQCTQLLTRAQSDPTSSPNLRQELENILVRLKIWAGNVGIFAPENASIDYRLRYDPDIAEVLTSMLTSLKRIPRMQFDPRHCWKKMKRNIERQCYWSQHLHHVPRLLLVLTWMKRYKIQIESHRTMQIIMLPSEKRIT